ncbi:MAG: peptidoglycan DD-metalloendopeptidase family protein [Coxiellaceae bacterium]|jgi:lipoprotein NlpD|nr:peptidoglycan DD-metalloendopeptidase family protein [Coxiellaceae bacterium]
MKQFTKCFLGLLLIIFTSNCAKPRLVKLPPVIEGWHKSSALKNAYIVQKMNTLYSIAWSFGVDYRHLATINKLKAPYQLHPGQHLYIASSSESIKYRPKSVNNKSLAKWFWPATGRIIATFSDKMGGNKGIDINGIYGQPIFASNSGRVVYSGTGIRSYGKLIIIKHNDDYLSAYAYNKKMLVEEGQEIKAHQKIAEMGYDNERHACLHFEIRLFGKPVNPLFYLPKQQ